MRHFQRYLLSDDATFSYVCVVFEKFVIFGNADSENFVEIDLGRPHHLGGIITQGSPSSLNWVTTFMIACKEGDHEYADYMEYGEIKV